MSATIFAGKIATLEGNISIPYIYNKAAGGEQTKPPYNVSYANGQPYVELSASLYNIDGGDVTFVNPNSEFVVYSGHDFCGAWKTAMTQLAAGQERVMYHLTNGNYISLYKVIDDYPEIRLYTSGGAIYIWPNASMGADATYYMISVLHDSSTDKIFPAVLLYRNYVTSLSMSMGSPPRVNNYFLDNTIAPAYTWLPFDSLNGHNGQYRCKLTMINADKIGDYTTPIVTSDRDDFDRISEQASLLSYFQNAPLGEPVTVAWSGNNWLTMTATKNPEPDTKDYLLNLQFRYALTDSIIYSYTARIQLEDYRHIPYLSFIVDDAEEVAVFDCVTYYSGSQSDPNPHWGYLGREQTEAAMHALWLWLQDSIGDPESDSPFNGGTTDNGGEGGNPTPQDDMPRPSLPSLDAANLGFFTVYNFTDSDETQLQAIAQFLWSDNVLDNFKKYFNNFSDNIFALYILPYTPSTLPTKNFKVGRLESETITGVKYLVSRYVDIPMGEVKVDPRWTSYVDYSPYTRFELYLPGIGIHSIDADDIISPTNKDGVLNSEQGSLISIKYTVDLFTGIVVAFVFINDQMRYQFSGKVGQTIPISGENYNSMVTAFITGAASLASSIASGGLSAPLAGAAVAGTISAQKPEVYRSGNMSGDVSLMSERTPYLIRHVPNKPEIIEQEKFTGFPSYKTGKVKDFGGYFEAEEIHVEGISCTEDERDELIELFKSGVIL